MFINILIVIIITVLLSSSSRPSSSLAGFTSVITVGAGRKGERGQWTMHLHILHHQLLPHHTAHCTTLHSAQCPLTTTQISSLPHNYFTVILCSYHSVQLKCKKSVPFLLKHLYNRVYFTVLVLSMQV